MPQSNHRNSIVNYEWNKSQSNSIETQKYVYKMRVRDREEMRQKLHTVLKDNPFITLQTISLNWFSIGGWKACFWWWNRFHVWLAFWFNFTLAFSLILSFSLEFGLISFNSVFFSLCNHQYNQCEVVKWRKIQSDEIVVELKYLLWSKCMCFSHSLFQTFHNTILLDLLKM